MRYIYYALCTSLTLVYSIVLPTIYWDPINPMFSCEVTIRAKLYDILNLECPTANVPYNNLYGDNDHELKENAYFLGTNERMFNECNAAGSKQLLYCSYKNDSKSTSKLFFKKDSGDPDIITFEAGKTYYIIGTGFRDAKNLDQLINGSCNTVEGGGIKRYRLRLKIYICTYDEIKLNKCGECTYAGCYFNNCENCTEWITDRNIEEKANNSSLCFSLESQICINPFLSSKVETRYRLVNTSCSTPTATPLIESTSFSSLHPNVTSIFTEPSAPTAARQASLTAKSGGGTTYIVVASLVALVIGIGIGALGFSKIHKKNCVAAESFNKICYEKKLAVPNSDHCFVNCNVIAK